MKPALRWTLLALLAAAVLGGLALWWLRTYERVSESVPLPRTGEAATDPLFALRLALEADGRRVRAWRRLDPDAMGLGPRDSLVLDGDPRAYSTTADNDDEEELRRISDGERRWGEVRTFFHCLP